jgi:ribosomal-protein-serine acetyltransferase
VSTHAEPSDDALGLPGGYALRAFAESDLDELHALVERNRENLARWLSWAQRPGHERAREHIARALRAEREGCRVERAIVLDGALVGDIGLYLDLDNAGGAIGYWLDRDHRGRGVMTAAVGALVRHGFEKLHLHRVEIRTDVLNRSSCAVAERLGFQREGVLRQSYRISDERYSDDAVYSMLASDAARRALAEGASAGVAHEASRRRR